MANMIDTKVQDWTTEQKDELLTVLKSVNENYIDIAVIGSRITNNFTQYSDLDVIIYGNDEKKLQTIFFNDIIINIYTKLHTKFHELILNKYKLPLYSLLNNIYYDGITEDINNYNIWKNRGKIN